MGFSVYSNVEMDVLVTLAIRLAEKTRCGTIGTVLDFGNASLARIKLDLIDRRFSQFDELFIESCEKISDQENINFPVCFPPPRFVFFEDRFDGMLTTDEMYQGLHYCIGEKGYSIKRY